MTYFKRWKWIFHLLIFKVNFINLNKPYAAYNIGKANTKSI